MRGGAPEYRHTAALSRGEEGAPDFWEGDVTIAFIVSRGFAATRLEPGYGASVPDWRIVAVDRRPVGEWPDPTIAQLVEKRWAELEPDLLAAAAEDDAYHAEQAAEARAEFARERRR